MTMATSAARSSRGMRSAARRRESELHLRLPLDQLDQAGEVVVPEPGHDGGHERLRDLCRDRHRYARLPRNLEQQTRVLRGQLEREHRGPPALVDALDHAIGEEVARAAGTHDLDHGAE